MKTVAWFALVLVLAAALTCAAAEGELRITSIVRQGDCTTLQWASRPGEFYSVLWTDRLGSGPIFWRVGAVNWPSAGTNTSWTDGECGQMGMMASGEKSASLSKPTLTAEELAARRAEMKAKAEAAIEYLNAKLREAVEKAAKRREDYLAGRVSLATPDSGSMNATLDSGGDTNVSAKFYRVARTAVVGIVDGWSSTPMEIPSSLTNVFSVSCGFSHSLAIRSNGTVFAWGDNTFGQCNVPTNLANVVAVAAGAYHSVAVQRDGSVAVWGDNTYGQVTNKPTGLTNVVEVKAGYQHSLALKSDGTVAAWGGGYPLTNAVPVGLSNVTAIAAFAYHCVGVKQDGSVSAWGYFLPGFPDLMPTNVPANLSNVVAVAAGRYHNLAILRDRTVSGWGAAPGATVPPGLTNIVAVGAGYDSGWLYDRTPRWLSGGWRNRIKV